MTSTVDIFTHRGSFGLSTRSVPALAFYEKYVSHVQAINLTGNFSDFSAPSAVFLDGDGKIYRGGKHHLGMKELDNGEPGRKQGWRMLTEHVMTAYLKGELAGEEIPVRRAMSWVMGHSEEEFEGKVWLDTDRGGARGRPEKKRPRGYEISILRLS
ncbi:hypothetical protein MMC29_005497 [Sticta canariensis]|nr:hypothetical protein [Sticta canariensis]